jgi:hypothetical protein
MEFKNGFIVLFKNANFSFVILRVYRFRIIIDKMSFIPFSFFNNEFGWEIDVLNLCVSCDSVLF